MAFSFTWQWIPGQVHGATRAGSHPCPQKTSLWRNSSRITNLRRHWTKSNDPFGRQTHLEQKNSSFSIIAHSVNVSTSIDEHCWCNHILHIAHLIVPSPHSCPHTAQGHLVFFRRFNFGAVTFSNDCNSPSSSWSNKCQSRVILFSVIVRELDEPVSRVGCVRWKTPCRKGCR